MRKMTITGDRPTIAVARPLLSAALCALCAMCAVELPGCASPEQATPPQRQAWSTKEHSVIGAERPMDALPVDRDVAEGDQAGIRGAALELLEQAADSTNPLLRAHAVEAVQMASRHAEAQAIVRLGLADENLGVRFVSAMTVGRLQMNDLAPLVQPLLDDPSPSVHAAAIYALRCCGGKPRLTPLADYALSEDPEVRANAAMILGLLGDPTALPILREAMHRTSPRASRIRNRIVELQIAEAMVRLGQDSELDVIRAALFAPAEQEGELVVLACLISGEVRDEAYASALADMASRQGRRQQPAEVRLAATQALAQIDASRASVEVPMSYIASDRYQIRAQAVSVLGWFSGPGVLEALRGLLDDPNPLVQVAAAGAVLRVTGR